MISDVYIFVCVCKMYALILVSSNYVVNQISGTYLQSVVYDKPIGII